MSRSDKFKEKCFNFALCHYKSVPQDKIKEAEFSLQNASCHNNAVSAFHAKRADKVWMVWAGKKDGCVHFINSKNGMFFDETLAGDHYDYFIIREIKKDEFKEISDLLMACKYMLLNTVGSYFDELFLTKKISDHI